jgi:hypothetical protein
VSRPGAVRVVAAMVGIFLAGGVAGGFAGAAWYKSVQTVRPRQVLAESFLRRLTNEVHLSNDQVPRVRSVILAHKDRFDAAFSQLSRCFHDVNDAVEAELTPEQVALYRAMLERDHERRERFKAAEEAAQQTEATPTVTAPPASN